MNIHKKNVTVWLMNEWILGLKHITLNRISFLKHYALKHILNNLNDGTYYVNINFIVCHYNNLFHIGYWWANHLFELAGVRERGMKVARTCAPASARLSLQAMRLSYFKKRFYLLIAEKYNVASQ